MSIRDPEQPYSATEASAAVASAAVASAAVASAAVAAGAAVNDSAVVAAKVARAAVALRMVNNAFPLCMQAWLSCFVWSRVSAAVHAVASAAAIGVGR
ncbi:hypothetical protein DNK48_19055 [Streptomyces malaysiensis subsp. malaysiensis]|nr:hypothetical protein DNK48_19055 [Streptomyces malaysiensis]